MNETFKVGEVAIINCEGSPHHGEEVIISSPLKYVISAINHEGKKFENFYAYGISGIKATSCMPKYLRKKRPPQELSSWDKVQEICGWNPQTFQELDNEKI